MSQMNHNASTMDYRQLSMHWGPAHCEAGKLGGPWLTIMIILQLFIT